MMNTPYPWLLPYTEQFSKMAAPQALIIYGDAGRGKAELAHAYAQYILGSEPEKHADFYSVTLKEKEKSISVDAIRALTVFSQQACQSAEQKVVIIEPADKMTIAAQQAFLKSLEEPVCKMTFILVARQAQKLLPTIKSRCQSLHIKPVAFSQAQVWLQGQGCNITAEEYALTSGSPLSVISKDFATLQGLIHDFSNNKETKLDKIEPDLILRAMYFSVIQKIKKSTDKSEQQENYLKLDRINALAKDYAEHASLNMNMQLQALLC